MRFIWSLFCVLSLPVLQTGAQPFHLELTGERDYFLTHTHLPVQFTSFIECLDALRKSRETLMGEGYLAASIDSMQWNDTMARASVFVGPVFTWGVLRNGNIPAMVLQQTGTDTKHYFQHPLKAGDVQRLFEKIIRYYENHGYPFASLQLDSARFEQHHLYARLQLDRGKRCTIDTIILNEESHTARSFLLPYLGLKQGMLYDESLMKLIRRKIAALNFLQESAPWKVEFNEVETKLYLFLKNKPSNQADVLIGWLPNTSTSKIQVTGDVKVGFSNALGYGEHLAVNWQNLQYQSPRYNIAMQWPCLAGTTFGLDGTFDFYKKDTTYKNVSGILGVQFPLHTGDALKAYYELRSTRVLNINIPELLATRHLPDNADLTMRTFGISWQAKHLEPAFNPRSGYRLLVDASMTLRNLLKNTTVENTLDPVTQQSFSYLYDNLSRKGEKYTFKAEAYGYLPLTKRIIFHAQYHGALMTNKGTLYKNELFQIGGYRLLRGFDEGSLWVNHYEVFTLEPHLVLSGRSYFFLFGDAAYTASAYNGVQHHDYPYSAGLGMTLETKAGLFNISYALGATKEQTMQFKNAKIHFGYVNYF